MTNKKFNNHENFHNHSRPMVVMENTWPSGASTGWHSHPRGQLLYAIQGVMIVNSEAGFWVVPPNRALWVTEELKHNVTMSGNVEMRTAYIDSSVYLNLPQKTSVINVSPLLKELLIEAVKIPLTGKLTPRDDRLLGLLIDELKVSDTLALHLPMPKDLRLYEVCKSLIYQPSINFNAKEWAKKVGMGERTLHRLFSLETGFTFSQWREQARLLSALKDIANGKKGIEVALNCGYSSQSAFSAMFRRHFGKPPSSFYQ